MGPLLFLLFFDTIADCLRHSRIIMYADDTVIYFSEKHIDTINSCINKDMEILSQFCSNNELILNMKRGKTESILFGTAQRLKGKEIEIRYRGELINSAERYTYLGNILDPTLTLNDDFQKKYKNASKRINLLIKMKPYLTENAVKKIYTAMVIPIIAYCSNLHLITTKYQGERFESLERRQNAILGEQMAPIKKIFERNACVMVRKCLDGSTFEEFNNYFPLKNQARATRNTGPLIEMPVIKLELFRKSFRDSGAKIFNNLPAEIREENNFHKFLVKVNSHFST